MAITRIAIVKTELSRLFMTSKETIVANGTPERVAYDLMVYIGEQEQRMVGKKIDPTDRGYWLTLYRQCYLAARGIPEEGIPSAVIRGH